MSHQASDEAFSMNGCRGGREPTKPRDAFQCQEWAPVIDEEYGLKQMPRLAATVCSSVSETTGFNHLHIAKLLLLLHQRHIY